MTDQAPTVFVLFGATGDLAKRMILPAFFELAERDLLPDRWQLVGNGRGDLSHEEFAEHVRESLAEFGELSDSWHEFSTHLRFAGGGFSTEDPGSLLDVLDDAPDGGRLVHFIALPPSTFVGITEALDAHGLLAHDARVVYEKPFGTSADGFRELDEAVHRVVDEERVFRIDHFLGKEATQNLHAFRFGNPLIAGAWNRDHIAEVQIDVPETLDVADRAEFYDETGAVLDMLVTHLFQLAAEVAMEPPVSMRAEDLQDSRAAVIAAFRPLDPAEVVLGQFDGYRDLEQVGDDSQTDTFVAARLWIDTDRWHGVPFVLRTGKQLAGDAERVTLVFRAQDGPIAGALPPTSIGFDLAGDGSIDLALAVKRPGEEFALVADSAALPLGEVGSAVALSPYAKLLVDIVDGDHSLFTTPEGLAATWAALEPIVRERPEVHRYEIGSWGPDAAADLVGGAGWLAEARATPRV